MDAQFLTVVSGVAVALGAQMDIIGGHSYPFITVPQQHNLGKFEYAFWIGHVLAIGFIKLTLLFLFRGLFKGEYPTVSLAQGDWYGVLL